MACAHGLLPHLLHLDVCLFVPNTAPGFTPLRKQDKKNHPTTAEFRKTKVYLLGKGHDTEPHGKQ